MVAVLFDLEETLTGSGYHFNITEVRSRMKERLVKLGVPPNVLEGLDNSLTLMLNEAYRYVSRDTAPQEFEVFREEVGELLEEYWVRSARESYLKPGALEALRALRAEGYSLGLVSNASRLDVSIALEKHGISHFFGCVVTSDEVRLLKPDPEGIRIALKKLREEEFVFVGDSVFDLEAARRAGGRAIIVQPNPDLSKDWQPKAEVVKAAGAHLVRSLSKVPRIIRQLFQHVERDC